MQNSSRCPEEDVEAAMAGTQSRGKAKGLSSAGLSLTRASDSLWTDSWDHRQSEDGQEMWTGLPGKREMGRHTISLCSSVAGCCLFLRKAVSGSGNAVAS